MSESVRCPICGDEVFVWYTTELRWPNNCIKCRSCRNVVHRHCASPITGRCLYCQAECDAYQAEMNKQYPETVSMTFEEMDKHVQRKHMLEGGCKRCEHYHEATNECRHPDLTLSPLNRTVAIAHFADVVPMWCPKREEKDND